MPARDHWRQAVCLFGRPQAVSAGGELELRVGHTPEMPWMVPAAAARSPSIIAPPPLHGAATAHIHDRGHEAALAALIAMLGIEGQHAVLVGDGPVLARMLPGAQQLSFSAVCSPPSATVVEPVFSVASELPAYDSRAVVAAVVGLEARWLVAEPFFYDMSAPGAKSWLLDEVIRFWRSAQDALITRPGLRVMPNRCRVTAQAVHCPRFFHTRQPIATVQGVDLAAFNTLAARPNALAIMDTQPWADDFVFLGEPVCLADLSVEHTDLSVAHSWTARLPLPSASVCHAVVFSCHASHDDLPVRSSDHRQAVVVVPRVSSQAVSAALSLAPGCASVWDALRGGVASTLSSVLE